MASRAPALAKPKPKAKATAKSSVSKSPAAKSPVSKTTVTKSSVSKASVKGSENKSAKSVSRKAVAAVELAPAKALKTAPTVKTKLVKSPNTKVVMETKQTQDLLPKQLALKSKPDLLEEVSKMTGTASFEPPAPKPRRRSKGEIRTRIYWAVFNQSLRRVAVFEFDQRAEAEKRADKLAKASGEHHFIQKIKAIVQ